MFLSFIFQVIPRKKDLRSVKWYRNKNNTNLKISSLPFFWKFDLDNDLGKYWEKNYSSVKNFTNGENCKASWRLRDQDGTQSSHILPNGRTFTIQRWMGCFPTPYLPLTFNIAYEKNNVNDCQKPLIFRVGLSEDWFFWKVLCRSNCAGCNW